MRAAAKLPARMSVAEFLGWDPGTDHRYELVDGEPRAMAPASRTHGVLQGELARLIGNHLRARGGACQLVVAPGVIPRLLSDHNMRVPDLGVTCTAYDAEQTAIEEPVLLVEILSPSNQAQTWSNVWTYTTIPSVREILILRTDRIAADLLRHEATGWPERPLVLGQDDELVLESVGFAAPLAAIYEGTRLRG